MQDLETAIVSEMNDVQVTHERGDCRARSSVLELEMYRLRWNLDIRFIRQCALRDIRSRFHPSGIKLEARILRVQYIYYASKHATVQEQKNTITDLKLFQLTRDICRCWPLFSRSCMNTVAVLL